MGVRECEWGMLMSPTTPASTGILHQPDRNNSDCTRPHGKRLDRRHVCPRTQLSPCHYQRQMAAHYAMTPTFSCRHY